MSRPLSHALSARNLILSSNGCGDLSVICAMCFNRLRSAQRALEEDAGFREEAEQSMGATYDPRRRVRHLLEVLLAEVGSAAIAAKVSRPLRGLRAASYYGCFLIRPPELGLPDDAENPQMLDRMITACGATAVSWSGKVDCCGGSLALTHSRIVARLAGDLHRCAADAGATCVVTACPMCLTNLETRADSRSSLPVFFFTELVGLALGLPDATRWLDTHLISPRPLLRDLRIAV